MSGIIICNSCGRRRPHVDGATESEETVYLSHNCPEDGRFLPGGNPLTSDELKVIYGERINVEEP